MKPNFVILIVLTACIVAFGNAFRSSAHRGQIAGGYANASPTDPEVVAAASFVLKQERRKLGRRLSLLSIERAEVQVVAGLNYRLCLKVRLKGKTEEFTAVVYKNLKQKYSLSNWDAGCKPAQ